MLSAISKADEGLDHWNRAYQSYSCLLLPDRPEDMPLSLQFAATATLINAQFKIADQVTDSSHSLWLFPQWCFSRSFRAASARLGRWEFPLAELRECSNNQAMREAAAEEGAGCQSAGTILTRLAEPTSIAAGLFFQHGARVVGNRAAEEAMSALGRAFGAMIYFLDALEDYERDFRNRQFNALRAAYRLSCERLPAHLRESITQTIRDLAAEIETILARLPITEARAVQFAERLRTNLSIRLDGKRGVAPDMRGACGTGDDFSRTRARGRGDREVHDRQILAGTSVPLPPASSLFRLYLVFRCGVPVATADKGRDLLPRVHGTGFQPHAAGLVPAPRPGRPDALLRAPPAPNCPANRGCRDTPARTTNRRKIGRHGATGVIAAAPVPAMPAAAAIAAIVRVATAIEHGHKYSRPLETAKGCAPSSTAFFLKLRAASRKFAHDASPLSDLYQNPAQRIIGRASIGPTPCRGFSSSSST